MKSSIAVQLFRSLSRDLGRVMLLLALVGLLLWLGAWLPQQTNEAALSPLLTSAALVLALAVLSHCTRRVLFPRLDLQEIALKAIEHPLGAALVFLGISMVLSVLVYANVIMLR